MASPFAFGIAGDRDAGSGLIVRMTATGSPPTISSLPIIYADPGVPEILSVRVTDPDADNVNVTWDWDDGSPLETNMTPPAFPLAQRVYNEHTWSPVIEQGTGNFWINYTLRVTAEDGNGNMAWMNTTVALFIVDNIGPQSDIIGPTTNVEPNDLVFFEAKAMDLEGESLTWTFVFNDTMSDFLYLVYYSPATDPGTWVWHNITYTFGIEGYFNVTLYVSDALGVNQTGIHNTSDRATVVSYLNKLPYASSPGPVPQSPIINETGYVNVTYSIEVYDNEGDVMNVTWDFGDGSPARYNESGALKQVYVFTQWVNYTDTGVFNVSVVVTDGRPNHEVYKWTIVYVNSTNLPPSVTNFTFLYSAGSYQSPNVTMNFTLSISDPELDRVQLIVSWGDGSPHEYYNLTDYVAGNVTIVLTHAYSLVGNYMIELWYTDNKTGLLNHSKYYNLTVKVEIPPPIIIKKWSWWDYTSLGLFAMIPVLIALRLWYVARQRRVIEAQGMTIEEYKLIQSERARQQEEALEHELAKQMEGAKR